MVCPRCQQDQPLIGELCAACRSYLLGDSPLDPSGRPKESLSQLDDWPFRAWGPLVDLRDPDDLTWINRPG